MGRRKIGGSAEGRKASKPNLVAAALELAEGPYASPVRLGADNRSIGESINGESSDRSTR
jgi:hypothetical protein